MIDRPQNITTIIEKVKEYPNNAVEATIIKYVSEKTGRKFFYGQEFSELKNISDENLQRIFEENNFPIDIEYIIDFFEALLDKDNIVERGIVFTPRYIADYISECTLSEVRDSVDEVKLIDPGCGCGIFLITAADKIQERTGKALKDIFNENIFGIDIDRDNVRRCRIVLNLYCLINGESNEGLESNILCEDSLKNDWCRNFEAEEGFDCIIGNPPYVNVHDLSRETAKFLKDTFETTKIGVYNIFYAFIEHGMRFLSQSGKLSFIVPNNFLTIKSAADLRAYLTENRLIEKIIDFADNMVFRPVRTYNCIIQLSNNAGNEFRYYVMEKTDDIADKLLKLEYSTMDISKLDTDGWKLVDRRTMSNIQKIEGQHKAIKEFVRTGIATLRDNIYIVDYDGGNYFKELNGRKYIVESDIVKRLYKIPELKRCEDIHNACKHIIFPYKKGKNGFEIIPEEDLKCNFSQTYGYLLAQKNELDARDKGKKNSVAWYAYGRTQGLNKYGRKLVFPTFAAKPRFIMIEDEYALFCNGYAVFENDYIELDLLKRILNSSLMQYYVKNTSYPIEGGYYCYQKKYIENFSLPLFSEDEKKLIKNMTDEELDNYLTKKYDIL